VTYRIEIAPAARKGLRALPRADLVRVDAAIQALAAEPRPHGCVKLTNQPAWRIRIGTYRVIYEIHDGALVVVVVDVGHRRDIYR
jgi:mRNA interferase RelE/StbE